MGEGPHMKLEERIKSKAIELGFVKAGITTAEPFPTHEQRFRQRLDHYGCFVAHASIYAASGTVH